ncbi:DUF6978 family protein [Pseudomonas sp. P2758]|uniref:DUF6978 family protein n=1 Tax=Pseudomonas sp. P2758 TaxID=3409916 RepID=UPI003B5B41C1
MVLSDALISTLLKTPKTVTNPTAKGSVRKKSERFTYQVESDDGSKSFELYTRQNTLDPEAYSCGLVFLAGNGEKVPLARYNGSNHTHRNPLEGDELIVNKCHIHKATERYMEAGDKAEKYAETTDRYATLSGALECMLLDCNISGFGSQNDSPSGQMSFF